MHVNAFFLVLTFMVLVIIILVSDSLTSAVLAISLLANLFVISTHLENRTQTAVHGKLDAPGTLCKPKALNVHNMNDASPLPLDTNEHEYAVEGFTGQPTNLYGAAFMEYDAYKSPGMNWAGQQPDLIDMGDNSGIDGATALMARRRSRDKVVMDGVAVRDANYYKHHFADELEESEQKQWWGNSEF